MKPKYSVTKEFGHFFLKNIYVFFCYLTALGLSCGALDLHGVVQDCS